MDTHHDLSKLVELSGSLQAPGLSLGEAPFARHVSCHPSQRPVRNSDEDSR